MSEQLDFSQYLYERRYNAQSKIDEAKIIKRKAMVAGAIGAVVIFAVMVAFILGAYDREQVALFLPLLCCISFSWLRSSISTEPCSIKA